MKWIPLLLLLSLFSYVGCYSQPKRIPTTKPAPSFVFDTTKAVITYKWYNAYGDTVNIVAFTDGFIVKRYWVLPDGKNKAPTDDLPMFFNNTWAIIQPSLVIGVTQR